jgi:hypothetical protein
MFKANRYNSRQLTPTRLKLSSLCQTELGKEVIA